MVERLVLTLLLILLGVAVYYLVKWRQQRRLSTVAVAGGGGRPLLVYFRSDHCAPCTTQSRFLEQLPDAIAARVAIENVDVEREKEKAEKYGVFTLPTTLLLDPSGSVRHVNYGLTDTGKLARQLESVL